MRNRRPLALCTAGVLLLTLLRRSAEGRCKTGFPFFVGPVRRGLPAASRENFEARSNWPYYARIHCYLACVLGPTSTPREVRLSVVLLHKEGGVAFARRVQHSWCGLRTVSARTQPLQPRRGQGASSQQLPKLQTPPAEALMAALENNWPRSRRTRGSSRSAAASSTRTRGARASSSSSRTG